MKLEEFRVYNMAIEIGEEVWNFVINWNYFERDTVGKQLVRAIDSVAANLSEGYGRYHYREAIHFSYYSRGSLYESKTWITKAHYRGLIDDDTFQVFVTKMDSIGVKLNNYINSIGKSTKPKTTNDH